MNHNDSHVVRPTMMTKRTAPPSRSAAVSAPTARTATAVHCPCRPGRPPLVRLRLIWTAFRRSTGATFWSAPLARTVCTPCSASTARRRRRCRESPLPTPKTTRITISTGRRADRIEHTASTHQLQHCQQFLSTRRRRRHGWMPRPKWSSTAAQRRPSAIRTTASVPIRTAILMTYANGIVFSTMRTVRKVKRIWSIRRKRWQWRRGMWAWYCQICELLLFSLFFGFFSSYKRT